MFDVLPFDELQFDEKSSPFQQLKNTSKKIWRIVFSVIDVFYVYHYHYYWHESNEWSYFKLFEAANYIKKYSGKDIISVDFWQGQIQLNQDEYF